MRLRLTIAYDGAPFAGWQRQTDADSIQSRIERAFTKVTHQRVAVHGAGRTDAGVHALAQVAHADVPGLAIKPPDLQRALNATLPPGIRVTALRRARPEFHARYSAKAKVYRYVIHTSPILPPHLHHRAWHVPQPIDLEKFRAALALYEGTHDFRHLSANRRPPPKSTIREIFSVDVQATTRTIRITYTGNGFLYKMVRMLTASALRIAQNRNPESWLTDLIDNPDGKKSNRVAPPDGLTLVRVIY